MEQKTPRWHLLYYVLAAFDLITIACSLFLNHEILRIYTHSNDVNSEWVRHDEQYEEISRLAGLVNAPGNDVFDSHDVKAERRRKSEALQTFNLEIQKAREEMDAQVDPTKSVQIKSKLSEVEMSMQHMSDEADLIFSYFEEQDTKKAGSRMATMDRKFAELNDRLRELRAMVAKFQKENLLAQHIEAVSLSRFEYFLGGTIVFIVGIVLMYGHWLQRRIAETSRLIKTQQSTLETSARLASLGTMSAGIAHEINNPLSIIRGHAQLLGDRAAKGPVTLEQIQTSAQKIIATCARVSAIVNGLRTFSRDGRQDPFQPIKVSQLITESVSFCKERFKNNNIDLRVNLPMSDFIVDCRQVQICQVVVNLLNNAFDAVFGKQSAWVEISAERVGERCLIRVKDCGMGIAKEIQEKMMTPFFTTKEVGKGTGLGLSISHTVVAQHEGSLTIDNSSTHTLFVIDIPIKQTKTELKNTEMKAAA